MYERQAENEKLKQDVIQSKIAIEGMDSELILLRAQVKEMTEQITEKAGLIEEMQAIVKV